MSIINQEILFLSIIIIYYAQITVTKLSDLDDNDDDGDCPICDDSTDITIDYIDPNSCDNKNNFLVPKVEPCKCFPGCEKRTGLFKKCFDPNTDKQFPACAPGLICKDDTPVENGGPLYLCYPDKESCWAYNFLGIKKAQHKLFWKPNCLSDTTYAPVQCKGEKLNGRCFCYDRKGNRLPGEQWWRDAENMTCACSRRRAELIDLGRIDVSLHCDSMGNYEPLQCDDGLCWCAENMTGEIISTIVPQQLMEKLPCYELKKVGNSYFRICESEAIAQRRMKEEFLRHGTNKTLMIIPRCDADGSYGHFQFDTTRSYYCAWKDKSRIQDYRQESETKGSNNMDCNCARDLRRFQMDNTPFSLTCNANGNYNPLQEVDDDFFCVDSDGFAVSDIMKVSNDGSIINCTDWVFQIDENQN